MIKGITIAIQGRRRPPSSFSKKLHYNNLDVPQGDANLRRPLTVTVEPGYNVMKNPDILCLYKRVFLYNLVVGYNVQFNSEDLIGPTEYLTLYLRSC